MKKIGLFYSFKTTRTADIALRIETEFSPVPVDKIDVLTIDFSDFEKYDHMIFGIPTWFDGELPTYWDELLPGMESLQWKNKKIALFGLGDQKKYPYNFGDALGIMAEFLEQFQADICGFTAAEGYIFFKSAALRDGMLTGLLLDEDNQPELTNQRLKNWVDGLKSNWLL